jgi:DNA-binding transcriptional ArsR family regulator
MSAFMPMPPASNDQWTSGAPTRRVMFIGTGGVLTDTIRAAELRDLRLPPTALGGATTVVLDLSGMTPTPAVLRELVVPLGQRLRGGTYGSAALVVATPDPAVAEFIDLLAGAHGLALYVSVSSSAEDVQRARPAGELTETEHLTLDALASLGGRATVSALSERVGAEPTAINNRLTKLNEKGYLYRYRRPRRVGDIYLDPRTPSEDHPATPSRDVLQEHGINTDLYDVAPLRLEGDAAKRAAEIARRRRGNA